MKRFGIDLSSTIKASVIEGIILMLGTIMVPLMVIGDRDVFFHGSSEHSATEITQAVLTLLTASVFWVCAIRHAENRAWLLTLGGLFTMILIREMDFYLDFIYHGFWSVLALLTLTITLMLARRYRASYRHGLMHFLSNKAYAYILIGFLVVVIFSRVFGSSDFLEAVMQEQYRAPYKTFIQEGLELFGYFLIACGTIKYARALSNRE